MGKLHSLRRAILRDPAAWSKVRMHAYFDKKTQKWAPSNSYHGKSYNLFIRKLYQVWSVPGP
jgi:uncharacterized membrane protein YjgN (DUF898 family)